MLFSNVRQTHTHIHCVFQYSAKQTRTVYNIKHWRNKRKPSQQQPQQNKFKRKTKRKGNKEVQNANSAVVRARFHHNNNNSNRTTKEQRGRDGRKQLHARTHAHNVVCLHFAALKLWCCTFLDMDERPPLAAAEALRGFCGRGDLVGTCAHRRDRGTGMTGVGREERRVEKGRGREGTHAHAYTHTHTHTHTVSLSLSLSLLLSPFTLHCGRLARPSSRSCRRLGGSGVSGDSVLRPHCSPPCTTTTVEDSRCGPRMCPHAFACSPLRFF